MNISYTQEALLQQLQEEREAREAAERLAAQRLHELEQLKQPEQDCKQVQQWFLEHVRYAAVLTDTENNITHINDDFSALFRPQHPVTYYCGKPLQLLEQSSLLHCLPPHQELVKAGTIHDEAELDNGRVVVREYVPITHSGKNCGSAWLFRDITDKRKQQLQSELQDEFPDPVLRISHTGQLLLGNQASLAFTNRIGAVRVNALCRLLRMHLGIGKKGNDTPASFETNIDGQIYFCQVIPVPGKGYFNIYMSDVTEGRKAEKALLESQNFAKNIARTIPNIVYIYDVEENKCIYLNEQLYPVLGYTPQDIEAMSGQFLTSVIVPEEQEKLQRQVQRMLQVQDGEIEEVEYVMLCKSGERKSLYCRESVFKRKENGQVKQVIGSAEDVTKVRQQGKELLHQKEFYESILNHIPSDVAVYDNELRYLFLNPAAVKDKHLREWIIGKTNEDYSRYRGVPIERMEYRSRHLQKVLDTKGRVEFEEHLTDKAGNDNYHIRRLNPVLDSNGEVQLIIGHGLTITELRKAQEDIVASEAKNSAILAAIPDLMFIINGDGYYLDMKNVDEHHLLVPKDKVIGQHMSKILPSKLADRILETIRKVLETGSHEKLEYDLELATGLHHYEGRFLKYSNQEVLAIVRDVTEEKKVALEVKEKNEFIRQVLDASPSLIYVKDGEGKFVLVNQEFSRLFNMPPEEIIGKSGLVVHHNIKEANFYLEIDQQVIQENREIRVQERHTTINGQVLWFNTIKKPLVTQDGQVHVLGISTNVTEQRNANKRLQNSEELHRLLSENSKDMISLHNPDGSYIYVSKAVEEMLGYTQAEMLRMLPGMIVHPDDMNALQESYHKALSSKENITIEHRLHRRDKATIWVETNIRPILNQQGELTKIQAAARDITERRMADEAIKHSEKKYRDLINYSQAFICSHDMSGVIQSVNPYLLNMLGYTAEEMVGHSLFEFIPRQHQEATFDYVKQFRDNSVVDGVLTILNKEGDERYLYYQNYKVEEPNLEPYIIAIAQDITDRMRTEQQLKKAKEAAEESARVKENFLANMSHEIRTPMNGILGMVGLLRKSELNGTQLNYLNIIRQSADNLLVVINDILDIAKIEAGKLELEEITFNVTEAIQSAFQTFIYKAEEKDIAYTLDPLRLPQPMVVGDPYRLNQVLLNLLNNAIKFTEEGSVTLSCTVLEDTEKQLHLEIAVADTGIGIPPDKMEYIFEGFTQAYSSITRKYGGTGLGLNISKNLIEMQGGQIWVESQEEHGSVFKVRICYPKSAEAMEELQEENPDYNSLGTIDVLLAEDNEVNVFLAQSILESWGANVDVAYNGREAVELAEKKRYDVVLMDIQMPELSGVDATSFIRSFPDREKANVPIIALTANALKGDAEKYMSAGMNDYLSKPFEEEKLFMKISALLPKKRGAAPENGIEPEYDTMQHAATEPLFDLSILEKMSRGNEAFIKRTKQLFVETVPVTVADMHQKRDQADWNGVSAAAHKLKSTIDTMRIEKLKDVVREIESNAKAQKNLPAVSQQIEVLTNVLNQVVEQLQADLV